MKTGILLFCAIVLFTALPAAAKTGYDCVCLGAKVKKGVVWVRSKYCGNGAMGAARDKRYPCVTYGDLGRFVSASCKARVAGEPSVPQYDPRTGWFCKKNPQCP